jgi:hypothetical protein
MRVVLLLAAALVACTPTASPPAIDAGLAQGGGTGPGPCSVECADSLCASASVPPTPDCEACLKRVATPGAACSSPVSLRCEADPDCPPEQRCVAYCLEPDAGLTDAGIDMACPTSGDPQACANCCARNHPTGYQTFFSALVSCGCGR